MEVFETLNWLLILSIPIMLITAPLIHAWQETRKFREEEARRDAERKQRIEEEQKKRTQQERERLEKERLEREQQERAQKERQEQERLAKERQERAQQEQERLEKQYQEWKERHERESREREQRKEEQRRERKRLITTLIRILYFEAERRIGMPEIDKMEGHQFEHYCAGLLRKIGFSNIEVTKGSGDQGVDIVAVKDSIRYAIQCKRYSSALGNSPIQEVNAGKHLYHCHVAVVLTNQHFTTGAKQLAAATGVLLWDRDKLQDMIKQAGQVIQ